MKQLIKIGNTKFHNPKINEYILNQTYYSLTDIVTILNYSYIGMWELFHNVVLGFAKYFNKTDSNRIYFNRTTFIQFLFCFKQYCEAILEHFNDAKHRNVVEDIEKIIKLFDVKFKKNYNVGNGIIENRKEVNIRQLIKTPEQAMEIAKDILAKYRMR